MAYLISPKDLTENTILSGNTDEDKYLIHVTYVQEKIIKEMLGDLLYSKIEQDYINDVLSGLYFTLYDEYVKKILIYYTIAEYVDVASLSLDNGGIFKYSVENKESVDSREIQTLKSKYESLAQIYIDRFEKWIELNPLTEFTNNQDGVTPTDINIEFGWKL